MLAQMPSFGEGILFVCLFATTVIIGGFVAGYAAHCFHVVVENTAAGNDEVTWPDEPFLDWFWKVFYLVWLAGVGVGVSWWLVRRVQFENDELKLASQIVAAVAGGWLLFPICLLSSLSANSPWVILRWTVLRQLGRNLGATGVFYGTSAALLIGCAVLGILGVQGSPWWLLIGVGPLLAAGLLIYARLLGRLALVVERGAMVLEAADDESPLPPEPALAPVARSRLLAPPPEPEPTVTLPVDGYEVQETERTSLLPLLVPTRPTNADDPERDPGLPVAGQLARPRRKPRERIEPPPLPRQPLLTGVYTFPWYADSFGAWLWLSLGLFAVCGLVRLLIMTKFW